MKKGLMIFALVAGLMLSMTAMAFAVDTTLTDTVQTTSNEVTANGVLKGTPTNANQTGVLPVNKNVSGQDMHENFQNNTNACASCHQTHSALAGKLLFASTELQVCSSCHDGTIAGGLYNVFRNPDVMRTAIDGAADQAARSMYAVGGTFDGNIASNSSAHLVSRGFANVAAPGAVQKSDDTTTTWDADFECSSCHAPHGSYSSVLLSNNPNNVALTTDASGNKLGKTGPYALEFRATYFTGDATVNNVYVPVSAPGVAVAGPWLTTGQDYASKTYSTRIVDTSGNPLKDYTGATTNKYNNATNLYVNYAGGYIKAAAVDPGVTTLYMYIAKPIVVKFTGDTYAYTSYGKNSSEFCAACHTDYNSTKGSQASTDTGNFRHTIAKGIKPGMQGDSASKMVCLTCHYAHGTSGEIQRDATDNYLAPGTMDQNPDSALKKYVNMSSCWKCHQESHNEAFINSASYWAAH